MIDVWMAEDVWEFEVRAWRGPADEAMETQFCLHAFPFGPHGLALGS